MLYVYAIWDVEVCHPDGVSSGADPWSGRHERAQGFKRGEADGGTDSTKESTTTEA